MTGPHERSWPITARSLISVKTRSTWRWIGPSSTTHRQSRRILNDGYGKLVSRFPHLMLTILFSAAYVRNMKTVRSTPWCPNSLHYGASTRLLPWVTTPPLHSSWGGSSKTTWDRNGELLPSICIIIIIIIILSAVLMTSSPT